MIEKINSPITVKTLFDHKKKLFMPLTLYWQNQDYVVKKVGLHYVQRVGNTLFHYFAVDTDRLFFKLCLNTDNLFWKVEEIADGLPD